MGEYKIEYLIMIKHKWSFCDNIESFNKLLETNSLLSIKKDKLIFKKHEFRYEIFTSDVKDKEQRFFRIKLSGSGDGIINNFIDLLKIVREQTYRADGNINTLWDDISNYYSIKAYPEINRIENLMRKLLTTFMLTNIGINWTDETLPTEVKSTIKRKSKNENHNTNLLHETDFIQLADFLFKPYQTKDINNLYKQLKNCKDISELTLEELREFIPKSNWERYFKVFVNCEDDYLNKKWARLYELRCIIAHNNLLSQTEFEEISMLVRELEPKIQEAIDNIDNIIIPKEEKEHVIENVVTSIDEKTGEFITIWKTIEKEIRDLHTRNFGESPRNVGVKKMITELIDKSILPNEFLDQFDPIWLFRNKLVHLDHKINQEEISIMIDKAYAFYNQYICFEIPFIEIVTNT